LGRTHFPRRPFALAFVKPTGKRQPLSQANGALMPGVLRIAAGRHVSRLHPAHNYKSGSRCDYSNAGKEYSLLYSMDFGSPSCETRSYHPSRHAGMKGAQWPSSPLNDYPTVTAVRPTRSVSPTSAALAMLGRGRSISGDTVADCPTALLNRRGRLRYGLKEMFKNGHISIVGEADNFRDLLTGFQTQPVPELFIYHIAPDQTPEAALNAISDLRRLFPDAKLLVLVDACTTTLLSDFICADVSAVLLTDISGEMLLRSLELVLFGIRIFPARIRAVLADNASTRIASERASTESLIMVAATTILGHAPQGAATFPNVFNTNPSPMTPLSNRERQIMSCLVKGWSNKYIAHELNIAETTVKVYLKCLSRKVRLKNRTQLAIWALHHSNLFGAAKIVTLMETHVPQVEQQAKAVQPKIFVG
jgi:two-component system nitrate/nitrite response regulator NarL